MLRTTPPGATASRPELDIVGGLLALAVYLIAGDPLQSADPRARRQGCTGPDQGGRRSHGDPLPPGSTGPSGRSASGIGRRPSLISRRQAPGTGVPQPLRLSMPRPVGKSAGSPAPDPYLQPAPRSQEPLDVLVGTGARARYHAGLHSRRQCARFRRLGRFHPPLGRRHRQELRKLDAHQARCPRTFSPDGKTLASRGGSDGTLRSGRYDRRSCTRRGLSKVNPWRFYREASLAFAPDSNRRRQRSKGVIIYEVGPPETRASTATDCMYVAYSPDGKVLATGGLGRRGKSCKPASLGTRPAQELRQCELPKNERPPASLLARCTKLGPSSRRPTPFSRRRHRQQDHH